MSLTRIHALLGQWLLLLITTMMSHALLSQSGQGRWYLSPYCYFDFSTSPPDLVCVPNDYTTLETCVSVSDVDGNFLFYSEGRDVYDRRLEITPNGSDLMGQSSSSQGVLAAPVIGEPSQYYVFILERDGTEFQLLYSIFDTRLNNGLGDIIPGQKNIPVRDGLSGRMTLAYGDVNQLFLITQRENSNEFLAFPITIDGIGEPISSFIGSVSVSLGRSGKMKYHSSRDLIAVANPSGYIEIFCFDRTTGTFSNYTQIENQVVEAINGFSFSPDGLQFYYNKSDQLYHVSLNVVDERLIDSSRRLIHTLPLPNLYNFMIGPDGLIYLKGLGDQIIEVIRNPNDAEDVLVEEAFSLANTNNRAVQPIAFPQPLLRPTLRDEEEIVLFDMDTLAYCDPSVGVMVKNPYYWQTYEWSNGWSFSFINVDEGGWYWVTVTDGACKSYTDSFYLELLYNPSAGINDTFSICSGYSLTLSAPENGIWQDGSTADTFLATEPGVYWVTYPSPRGCPITDSLVIIQDLLQPIDLLPDTTLCGAQTLELSTPAGGIWQDGTTAPTYTINAEGQYWVNYPDTDGCTLVDSIQVTYEGDDRTPAELSSWTAYNDANCRPSEIHITYSKEIQCASMDMVNVTLIGETGRGYRLDIYADACESGAASTQDFVISILDAINITGNFMLTVEPSASFGILDVCDVPAEVFQETIVLSGESLSIIDLPIDTTICGGTSLQLDVSDPIATDYLWSDGSVEPQIAISDTGRYEVTVSNDCDTQRAEIHVIDIVPEGCDICEVYVPNIFSPAGTGLNAAFTISTSCNIQSFQLSIYNRWGQQVYQSNDVTSAWTGYSTDGRMVSQGVYVYRLEYSYLRDGERLIEERYGDVLVVD